MIKNFKNIIMGASIGVFGAGILFAVKASRNDNFERKTTKDIPLANVTEELETKSVNIATTDNTIETTSLDIIFTEEYKSETIKTEIESESNTEPTQQHIEELEEPVEISTESSTEMQTEAIIDTPTEIPTTIDDTYYHQAILNSNMNYTYMTDLRMLINEIRVKANVSYVSFDAKLDIMANHRAYENASNNWFVTDGKNHIRPNGDVASTICNYYEQYGLFGEVMGRYQASAQEIIDGWCNSPAHYACIVNPNYTRVGIGVAQDANGDLYWVAIFMD